MNDSIPNVNTSIPNAARMYDYYLGGKDHFAADRKAADEMIRRIPQIPAAARGNRRFLRNAVCAVAGAGVRQFIDLGSGLPTEQNTHEIAHEADPGIRVAYVDNDPAVVTHARAILKKGNEDTVTVLDGDLREPQAVTLFLDDFIDFRQPVAVMLVAVLHFIETPRCYRIVNEYKDKMAPGSCLILSHATADFLSEAEAERITGEYDGSNLSIFLRGKHDIARFFGGLALTGPGITNVESWRSGPHTAQRTLVYGGVGRKGRPA